MILNQSINKAKIKSEINSLSSEFEIEYLTALLEKRDGNFEDAFNRLFPLLKDSQEFFDYYEQMSNLGKITGNLEQLSEWLEQQSDTLNYFKLYLKGLVENEKGFTESSISTYEKLITKGFSSKEVYYQLAFTLRKIGNYEDAFSKLSKAEIFCQASGQWRYQH